jgi:hypothetical protein
MKSVLAFLPLVAAVPVPRIELDLSGTHGEKLDQSIYRAHDLGTAQPDGSKVLSRQDWTERCPAGAATTTTQCPFPIAKAFDHQDKAVQVTTRVFLVDVNGRTCGAANPDYAPCANLCHDKDTCEVTTVEFGQRSTFLFKYDAKDAAGNHAEQVVFALILDDATKPTLEICGAEAETIEAASKTWGLCKDNMAGTRADDNIDNVITDDITYSIETLDGGSSTYDCRDQSWKEYLDDTTGDACAVKHLKTNKVGRFLVSFKVCDEAGVYGENSQNNCKGATKAVLIKDTLAPWIDVKGAEPTLHECGIAYTDQSADVFDLLDTCGNGEADCAGISPPRNLNAAEYFSATGAVDSATVADYTITYKAHDYANNEAAPKTRTVEVRDTTKPVVTRVGNAEETHYACDPNHPTRDTNHPQHDASNTNAVETGACPGLVDPASSVTCTDTCAPAVITPVRTWNRNFNEKVLGDYIRTYTCTDAAGNADSVTRKFTIVDEEDPVIQIMGSDDETYDASNTVEYTDKGATCEDYVDGVLSHAVEVSGQVVNMRVPGTYTISYDCEDLSKNQAKQMHRTVTVQDISRPVITLLGQQVINVEAGFEYVDAGATASDDLDGDISHHIWTDGDTVTTSNAFYSLRSCREISAKMPGAAKSGSYYITTYVTAKQAYQRTLVHCDMLSKNAAGVAVGYTYYPCDECNAVVPYGSAAGDCAKFGLKMAKFAADDANTKAYAKKTFGDDYFADSSTTEYLCSTNDQDIALTNAFNAHSHSITHDKITRAETGKYVIFYHVSDSSGNAEESSPSRTVIVRDTLPPVITLHLHQDLIHTSDASQHGLSGEVNPAGLAAVNDNLRTTTAPNLSGPNSFPATSKTGLMAEEASTSSVNGWVIGAVASTITGLALLSMTSRKVATTVEV